jgi:type IV secretion system protein VirB1
MGNRLMLYDVPVLLTECAPMEQHQILNALVKTESGGDPYVIHDNSGGKKFLSKTAEEAISTADSLLRQGHSIDMGLVQINSKNLPKLGLSVRQIFDPCTNIKAASTIWGWGLQMAVGKYGAGQQATLASVSAYNTGNLSAGFANGYVKKVVSNMGGDAHLVYASMTTVGEVGVPEASPYSAPLTAAFGVSHDKDK